MPSNVKRVKTSIIENPSPTINSSLQSTVPNSSAATNSSIDIDVVSDFPDDDADNDSDVSNRPKRMPKLKRTWVLERSFGNKQEAKDFIKAENTWSVSTTN